MYVDIAYKKQNSKSYKRVLLRHNYREDGKIKHKTIANISNCTDEEIQAIKLALKNKKDLTQLGSFTDSVESNQGLSVGAILLLKHIADSLDITKALGNSIEGKLALWQVMARIIGQGSRLSAVRLAQSHAVCDLLGIDNFTEDSLYKNLDWLSDNQEAIEERLFALRCEGKEVSRLYLYDVTSSYLEGVENELGEWGYNRDKKKGKKQIVIGLLTDEEGVPVSVEVFRGNTGDTKTVLSQIKKLAERFKIKEVTIVGDKGMIKSVQIEDLKEANFNYITAITKAQIESLIKEGIFQLELFSSELCEILSKDNVRYILRRNPHRAEEIEGNREDKIKKVKTMIEKQNIYLKEHEKAKVEVAQRKIQEIIKKLKLSEYVAVKAIERGLIIEIEEQLKEEVKRLDGCYVIKTELSKEVAKEVIHNRYKDLALVEKGFRTMKTGYLETRPIYVRKEKRTRGHVFVVMLAYVMIQELQKIWSGVDIEVQEGVTELSSISNIEIIIEGIKYNQIPEPRALGKKLLDLAGVKLPNSIPNKNGKVATIKKLPQRRK